MSNLHATKLLRQVNHPRRDKGPSQPVVDGQFSILANESLEHRLDILLAVSLHLGVHFGGRNLFDAL